MEMKKAGQVFAACLIGAGLGAFIALEVAHVFWWVGLIVGFFAGYLTYKVKDVGRAIVAAARAVFKIFSYPLAFWKMLVWVFVCTSFFSSYVVWLFSPKPIICGLFIVIFASLVMAVVGAITIIVLNDESDECKQQCLLEIGMYFRHLCYLICPVIVLFWHIPRGLWFIAKKAKKIPVAIVVIARELAVIPRLLARFVRLVFLQIHSEIRLLCGVDAMFGAAIGYFAGSAVIGAIAGGVLGLVNYAVITKRILEPRGLVTVRR